jgi:hypothetical protein
METTLKCAVCGMELKANWRKLYNYRGVAWSYLENKEKALADMEMVNSLKKIYMEANK